MAWPPELEALKTDLGVELADTRDDGRLEQALDAAVAFTQRVRAGDFDFDNDPASELPDPTADVVLGTIRYARRWYERRRSPEGLVDMGELGVGRVPSVDPDIDRLLGIGRYTPSRFA